MAGSGGRNRDRMGQDGTGRDAAAPPRATESRCSSCSTQAPPLPTAAPRRRAPPGPPPPPSSPLRTRGAGPSPSRTALRLGQPGPQAGRGAQPSRMGSVDGTGPLGWIGMDGWMDGWTDGRTDNGAVRPKTQQRTRGLATVTCDAQWPHFARCCGASTRGSGVPFLGVVAVLPYMARSGPGMGREARQAQTSHCQAVSQLLEAHGAVAFPGALGQLQGMNGCAGAASAPQPSTSVPWPLLENVGVSLAGGRVPSAAREKGYWYQCPSRTLCPHYLQCQSENTPWSVWPSKPCRAL
ncbi:uncharacterized protein LOC121659797 [Corvus kubaryi]|uniref:uncharacterized protein LOC121659797 n=1 Tax=Corvus kubaryi TaxID=68294 RepID=UPI001C059D03|nr:uncharacterized protein LOC121659797 [Corvus kubaryi]XP_041874261.1 uncharacterized protein LOC121659797 [Corvus kubaryi]XP_041874262.1 uncharacterized protein LOC121659797 [Corvus kubaryi]XP_041874263.1 uncharacterized protein LOC121659797 [Corvus kubaryi]XP_041874265.1 uncharacterized protein LOC121659797 [Corvus kubaryi]